MPLVSVVMPVYNAATTLGASVRSVLAQTHGDWELLVTDDGSTDDSWDALEAFARADERIKPERGPGRSGTAGARNAAIGRADGDYVAFLDSDDLWLPTKLDRQLAFAARGSAPLTFTSYFKVDAAFDGEAVGWAPISPITAMEIPYWAGLWFGAGVDEGSEVLVWVRAVATAILAGVIAQILVQPPGALAGVPDWLRYGAVAAGFAVFMLTRRSIFAGVVGGEIVLLAGKWWLG